MYLTLTHSSIHFISVTSKPQRRQSAKIEYLYSIFNVFSVPLYPKILIRVKERKKQNCCTLVSAFDGRFQAINSNNKTKKEREKEKLAKGNLYNFGYFRNPNAKRKSFRQIYFSLNRHRLCRT